MLGKQVEAHSIFSVLEGNVEDKKPSSTDPR